MKRLNAFFANALLYVIAYAIFIVVPLQYIPLPGYRQAGEPISGGWAWGTLPGCFDNLPVMQFVDSNAEIVIRGKSKQRMFENLKQRISGDYVYVEGRFYPYVFDKRKYVSSKGKFVPIKIKYYDLGKLLRPYEITIDGNLEERTKMRGDWDGKEFKLVQCGYPSPYNYLLRILGVKKYWRALSDQTPLGSK